MNLTFPLCREPRHDERLREVLAGCVDFVMERVPSSDLAGIVLTGSFSRGEGSVLPVDGRLRVLGDIELLVVLAGESEDRRLRPEIARWGAQASRRLAASGVRVDVEFGPVGADFFGKARPSIFVHDLVHHGKVLCGPPDLLSGIPGFGPEQIPREDALFLLFNRTVEQLETYDGVGRLEGDTLLDAAYQGIKLVLDLSGSALAFAGRHCASYARRPSAFAGLLAETPSLAALLPPRFLEELEEVARFKVDPTGSGTILPPHRDAAERRAWVQARIVASAPIVARVVRWELEQLLHVRAEVPALLDDLLASAPFRRRAWDWAKVALHPMPPPLPLSRLRAARLFWRSTPRLLLYAAAMHAFLHLATQAPSDSDIRRLLPVRDGAIAPSAEAHRRAIVALWRWCVRND